VLFFEKIENLKENINKEDIKEQLTLLANKMENSDLKINFKTVSKKVVHKAFKKFKKKKSSGRDGLSQEHLDLGLGSNVLINPLTKLINESISKGDFPKV
jgi:hypothetical protein